MKLTNKKYFLWLLDRIEYDGIDIGRYEKLLWYLYQTDFIWSIENDGNRAVKGLNLRYEYDKNWDYGSTACSVLEMLIVLAHDWEHEITYDFQKGDRTALWFWTMLKNLDVLNGENVKEKTEKWLKREFDAKGIGSPFPVLKADKDQRKVEIWMQVQGFVMENTKI